VSFTHARRIAGYNWPLYAAAGAGIVVGVAVAAWPGTPAPLRWLAIVGVVGAAWLAGASFGAFHWMFDRSELLGGRWLAQEVDPPSRWVQVNAGLDETTLPIHEVFPAAQGKVLDIYDPGAMTEPAITRARQERAGAAAAEVVRSDALPVTDGWAELAVVTLAAHEIRDTPARERFFRELARVVSPAGKVVVVEHLRDLPAALAFGPGIFHFLPRREWLRLGDVTGLVLERERRITPFVRVFVYRHAEGAKQ
jgi:SAM-dependent methyltransferase